MVDMCIIFLAVTSQVLSWVSIAKSFQIFAKTKRKFQKMSNGSVYPTCTKFAFRSNWIKLTSP